MKKLIRINCIAMAIFALMAFSCDPVDKDSVLDEDTEITPGNPDAGDDQPGEGQDPTPEPEPEPEPTPDPTPEPDPTPSEAYYVKVAQSYDDWSGDYLITYTSGSSVIVLNSFGDTKGLGKDISSSLTSQGIHSSVGDQYKATMTKDGDAYNIYVAGIGYIGYEGGKNKLHMNVGPVTGSSSYQWTLSYKDGGSLWLNISGRRLQWNNSDNCFRCYTGSQEELTLYRRTTSTGGSTPSTPEPDPDPTPTPTPDPNDNCPYDWYELPTINYTKSGSYLIDSNDKNLYYAHHFCAGGEKYAHNGKTARNYTVCYSADHHCPVWVAAIRHKDLFPSRVKRTDSYGKDPSIPSDVQYSSKETGGGCNKGHMLGSAERTSSTATNKQVFYYTNIAPQYDGTFNTGGGAWNILEDWVDRKVCTDTLYMVIGTYFDEFTDQRGNSEPPAKISFGGRSDVSRPTMFYYVLMRTKSGNTGKSLSKCTADEIMCAAFVRSHDTPKSTAVGKLDIMSVSALEKVTGFTYFPNVPHAPKSTCNASDWGL